MIEHVAIVGAGFSGTLHAINLLRHNGPRATLIERGLDAGAGLAYGSAHPLHLLNVRSGKMSAFPDQPDHLVQWLKRRGHVESRASFISRLLYGDYLRELLDQALEQAGDRLSLVQGDVVDLRSGTRPVALLSDGRQIEADAIVLAPGNLPPHTPPGLDPQFIAECYRPDPWATNVSRGLGPDDSVLILGTGLTMVDVALKLRAEGFEGPVAAISRRGLLPRSHADTVIADQPINVRPTTVASALIHDLRARAVTIGWRNAVDELRPFTQAMWRTASTDERARFLRHLRPWWDVHRHRLAPAVAERLKTMQSGGQLTVLAGKLVSSERARAGVTLTWRPRGSSTTKRMHATRIINCIGPQGDLLRSDDPLLRRLTERGLISPDADHLGINVSSQAEVIAADGSVSGTLFAVGPMTRGAFWEIVAVPDIREQAWTLARRLANAHWMEGEGL